MTQIDREEKELKQNLTRLHEERQLRTRADATRGSSGYAKADSHQTCNSGKKKQVWLIDKIETFIFLNKNPLRMNSL